MVNTNVLSCTRLLYSPTVVSMGPQFQQSKVGARLRNCSQWEDSRTVMRNKLSYSEYTHPNTFLPVLFGTGFVEVALGTQTVLGFTTHRQACPKQLLQRGRSGCSRGHADVRAMPDGWNPLSWTSPSNPGKLWLPEFTRQLFAASVFASQRQTFMALHHTMFTRGGRALRRTN